MRNGTGKPRVLVMTLSLLDFAFALVISESYNQAPYATSDVAN